MGVGSAKTGGTGAIMVGLLEMAVRSRFGSQKIPFFLGTSRKEDLLALRELIEAGKVRPIIDRTYPLTEAAEALRYLEMGHARAKVIITV